MLRIRHDSFGIRWVIVPTNEISTRARAFAEQVELENGPRIDKLMLAFIALHDWAPKFVVGPLLLAADSNSDLSKEHFDNYLKAAAFAMEHGVRTVYDLSEEPNSVDLPEDLDFRFFDLVPQGHQRGALQGQIAATSRKGTVVIGTVGILINDAHHCHVNIQQQQDGG